MLSRVERQIDDRANQPRSQQTLSQAAMENRSMKRNHFPVGWDAARTRRVQQHYERQTDDAAVAEDEVAARQTNSHEPNKTWRPTARKPRRG
jgi:hypothetical protein